MGANLSDLVKIAAEATPDKPAIIINARITTWSELDRRVRAVAGGLTAMRLDRGDRVLIVLGNSLEFVATYFGVLRAGMVAVPINSSYTAPEIEIILRSSGARLAVTDPNSHAAVSQAAGHDVSVIEVGSDDWRRFTVGSTPPPVMDTDPESLAVLIYTAGTSGTPKGAMLTHRALLANLDQLSALDDPAPMTADDIGLIVLPMFHIFALNAALGLVAKHGATAVISERFDPIESLQLIQSQKITNIAGAPPMYIAWSTIPGVEKAMSSVRVLISGAAPLMPAIHQQFETLGLIIWEGYGMTEASPAITFSAGVSKPGSVGKPVPGCEVKLIDARGNEVHEGDPGEILVRGPNLFSGYWPDGEGGPNEEGWFNTGDVGLIDADGNLRLVDRRSDLILVSGFNVYPREIESVLGQAPGVAEVAVVGVPHPYTGEAVKATVVAEPGAQLNPEELVEFAQQRLARFKAPTIVEIVDELPHSVTGKIMKQSLKTIPADLDLAALPDLEGTPADNEPTDNE